MMMSSTPDATAFTPEVLNRQFISDRQQFSVIPLLKVKIGSKVQSLE